MLFNDPREKKFYVPKRNFTYRVKCFFKKYLQFACTIDNGKTNIFRAVKFIEDLYLQKDSIKVTGSLLTGTQREKVTTTPNGYITIIDEQVKLTSTQMNNSYKLYDHNNKFTLAVNPI